MNEMIDHAEEERMRLIAYGNPLSAFAALQIAFEQRKQAAVLFLKSDHEGVREDTKRYVLYCDDLIKKALGLS